MIIIFLFGNSIAYIPFLIMQRPLASSLYLIFVSAPIPTSIRSGHAKCLLSEEDESVVVASVDEYNYDMNFVSN